MRTLCRVEGSEAGDFTEIRRLNPPNATFARSDQHGGYAKVSFAQIPRPIAIGKQSNLSSMRSFLFSPRTSAFAEVIATMSGGG